MTPGPRPADVPALIAALMRADPGRPRVTWYGPDAERVELSARVLDNWVAKTANLLVDELDAGPGASVRVELPMHWRSAVWALAAWAAGAELVHGGPADVAVVAGASPPSGPAGRLVAVALPALARSVPDLPAGALDYNAEVSGHGDVFVADSPTPLPPDLPTWPQPPRLLVGPSRWDPRRTLLAPLACGGSVVLSAAEPVPASVREAEQVTAEA